MGKRLLPAVVGLVDSVRRPADAASRNWDDEGHAVAPVMLVDQGRLAGFLHEASAKAVSAASSGRGFFVPEAATLAAVPCALHMLPGANTLPADYTELCARLETFSTTNRGLTTLIVGGYTVVAACVWRSFVPSMWISPR